MGAHSRCYDVGGDALSSDRQRRRNRRRFNSPSTSSLVAAALVLVGLLCAGALATPTFKVGLLLPFHVVSDPSIDVYAAEMGDIADMAAELINNRSTPLVRSLLATNITLNVVRRNEGSDQQVALFSAITLHQQDAVDVVVGADWSACSMLTQFYFSGTGILQISASSTSAALSNRQLYPTFMRLPPSDAQQGAALASIVRYLGWDNVATISADDDYGKPLATKFREMATSLNVSVVQSLQLGRLDNPAATVRVVKASGAKIIALMCFTDLAMALLTEFAAAGMATKEYVYLGVDAWLWPTSFQVYGKTSFAGGVLGVNPFYGGAGAFQDMLDQMTAYKAANASRFAQFNPTTRALYNGYEAYLYDTFMTLAGGLSAFAAAGHSLPQDVMKLYAIMNNVTFSGTTGLVKFTAGERLGRYIIVNRPPGATQTVSVGSVDAANNFVTVLDPLAHIVWGEGSSTIPSDAICTPPCTAPGGTCVKSGTASVCRCASGWTGSTCGDLLLTYDSSSKNITPIVAPVVVVCGTLIIAAIAGALYAFHYARKVAAARVSVAPALDLESPMAKAMKVIENIRQNKLKGEALEAELKIVEDALIANNMYQPEMEPEVVHQNIGLETVQFLDNLLMTRLMPERKTSRKPRRPSAFKDQSMASMSHTGSMGERVRSDSTNVEAREVATVLESLARWDFNIFSLEALTMGHPLCALTFEVMWKLGLFEAFPIDQAQLKRFLLAMESGYMNHNAVYHTSTHAADVLHAMFVFLQNGQFRNLFSPREMLAACLACVAHDLDHPGVTNSFMIATGHELALLYNDTAVLENHHSATFFKLLQDPDTNILRTLDPVDFRHVRKLICQLILSTDVAQHFEHLAKFKTRTSSGLLQMDNDGDRSLLLIMAIKCADVSNPTRPKHLYDGWTARIMEEFYRQGDREREMGMPVSMFMDRLNPCVAKCQNGFIEVIVSPLFKAFTEFVGFEEPFVNVTRNHRYWKRQLDGSIGADAALDVPSTQGSLRQGRATSVSSMV